MILFKTYKYFFCENISNNNLFLNNFENNFENNLQNECLLCLENKDIHNNSPLKFKQHSYFSECNCDSYYHIICLYKWYEKYKKCPICLVVMTTKKDNKNNNKKENNITELIYKYSYILNIISNVLILFDFFLIICHFCNNYKI
jgi:hypothetical protein